METNQSWLRKLERRGRSGNPAAALEAHATELRRIERNLHDGAQNRLVGVVVLTAAAKETLERDPTNAAAILDRVQTAAEDALADLRMLIRSILPPVLESHGLDGTIAALAAACPVPCRTDVVVPGRLPAALESTAYFAVAEALTNVANHSAATESTVDISVAGGVLSLQVFDNGRGGAVESAGSGIAGISSRVAAQDGTLSVSSPLGGPTLLSAELPCGS